MFSVISSCNHSIPPPSPPDMKDMLLSCCFTVCMSEYRLTSIHGDSMVYRGAMEKKAVHIYWLQGESGEKLGVGGGCI